MTKPKPVAPAKGKPEPASLAPADFSSPPVKITDCHKPSVTFNGYGGGYGGQ